ncbi:hypothetical protein VTI28DRAFT_2500 [Corynascus sepedonium]
MTDPLSIPGSVVGIISLGLQVTQYLFDYYSALKNRETHLSGTITKLEQLLKVLEVVRTHAEAGSSRPDEDNQFGNILTTVQRCEECIQELKEEADEFRESPTQAHHFGAAARATVRRIVYPLRRSTLQKIEEDIDEILTHLSVAQLSWIQKELDEIRDDVEDTKALLEQMRANQVSSEIRKWLNAPDATTNLNIACANKHPGSGKSVLCSTAIQHTYRHIQRRPRAGLAFFYFSFSDSGKQNVESLLRALILQLSSQLQKGSQLLALYQRHHAGTPPYQDLLSCLSEIIQDFADVYLIIDALDESPRSLGRDAVLQALTEIRAWSEPRLHLLVTSRDEADIREELHAKQDEIVILKNDSIDRDIALFISQHLRQNRRLRKWERHYDRIEKTFTERAKGVFRWVECQFRALASCPRSEDLLEQLLQSLPATLDETYRRMILNIPPASAPYAHQILSLLCCSERPLKVAELLDAVAVELGGQSQVFKYNPKRRLEDGQAILERPPSTIGSADSDTTSSPSFLLNQRVILNSTPEPVLAGAARGGHLEVVKLLLDHGAHPDPISLRFALVSGFDDIAKLLIRHGADVFSTEAAALHAASWSGRLEMVEFLLNMGVDPNQLGGPWAPETPLMVAASYGRKDIARLLLKRGALVENPTEIRAAILRSTTWSPNDFPQALFSFLSEEARGVDKRHATWDSLLLETPEVGSLDTIRDLLGTIGKAEPLAGTLDRVLDRALHSVWAKELFRPLLTYGVDPHISIHDVREIFDKENLFRLLVCRGLANANQPCIRSKSALTAAAATGSKELVQAFLENGADVNGRNDQGKTALSIAAQFDYRELVPVLLEAGADINAQDNVKRTPMLIAFEKGYQSTIPEQLIKAGADISLPDKYGWNILHRASWNGRLSAAELMLNKGLDPTALENIGRSPLFLAASAGHLNLVRMLLVRAPWMKDQKDYYGLSPLSAAAIMGRTPVVELLLASRPADIPETTKVRHVTSNHKHNTRIANCTQASILEASYAPILQAHHIRTFSPIAQTSTCAPPANL